MKKVAIVTGASAGLGVEFARQIDGWDSFDEIWLIARRADRLEVLANELKHPSIIIAADLATDEGIKQVTERLPDVEVSLLINNAGFGKDSHFVDTDSKTTSQMMELNMITPVKLIQACLPQMKPGSGIINVASTAGFVPLSNLDLYSATKAFLLHFSLCLRAQLRGKGISVLTVCPGPVRTEFNIVASEGDTSKVHGAKAEDVIRLALQDYHHRALSIYGLRYKIGTFIAKVAPKMLVANLTYRR